MLHHISYAEYCSTLTPPLKARLDACFEWAAVNALAIPALAVIEIERLGYTVNLADGAVTLVTEDRIVDCGHISSFYRLLALAMCARINAPSRRPKKQGAGNGQG